MIERHKINRYIASDGIAALNILDYLMQNGGAEEDIRFLAEKNISHALMLKDCADFRVSYLVRVIYSYSDVLPEDVKEEIWHTLMGFPYSDCGGHSMCTWTENHRLYTKGSEFLLAQLLIKNPEFKYSFADGRAVEEHLNVARYKLLTQLKQIIKYGFSEWGSNNYYPETLAALANILQFSEDEGLNEKTATVINLLLTDICSQSSVNNGFTYNPATARAYADNKQGARQGNYLEFQIRMLLGERFINLKEKEACFQALLDARDESGELLYTVPESIINLLKETCCGAKREVALKQGLNISEYKKEGFYTDRCSLEESAEYAFAAGAISHYSLISKNIEYLCKSGLINNGMLKALSVFKSPFFYKFGVVGAIKRVIPVVWDGAATEEGRVYTYIGGKYSISAACNYHVGKCLFQQNVLSANLSSEVSLFTSVPAKESSKTDSPDYWTGSRIAPRAMACKNVAMCIYDLKKVSEKNRESHLFFPTQFFDELDLSDISKGRILGRAQGVNISIFTNPGVFFRPIEESLKNDKSILAGGKLPEDIYEKEYDLINKSSEMHYYVFEVDDTLTFDEFKTLCADKRAEMCANKTLKYVSKNVNYEMTCKGRLLVNGTEFSPEFKSLESFYRECSQ